MAKLVALRKTAADKRAEEAAGSDHSVSMPMDSHDDAGPTMHLLSHHLNKMGVEGELPEGHEFEFRGHVEAHQTGHDGGEDRSHMRIRITHGGTDKPKAEHGDLRSELKKNKESAEKKAADRDALRAAKKVAKHEAAEVAE